MSHWPSHPRGGPHAPCEVLCEQAKLQHGLSGRLVGWAAWRLVPRPRSAQPQRLVLPGGQEARLTSCGTNSRLSRPKHRVNMPSRPPARSA
eukprot:scaffold133110_cov63-Phaeocystis_antarctica.AAC.4